MRMFIPVSVLVTGLCAACGPQSFSSASAITIMGGEAPPPPEPPVVEVTENQIVIHQKIQFELNSDEIRPESFGLLSEIAGVIKAHTEIARIRVEGHASHEGSAQHNQELSQARAEAVRTHLINQGGVEASRLSAKGYGESRPLTEKKTDEGYEINRRVEFQIEERR